jgi:hypothetical protein
MTASIYVNIFLTERAASERKKPGQFAVKLTNIVLYLWKTISHQARQTHVDCILAIGMRLGIAHNRTLFEYHSQLRQGIA